MSETNSGSGSEPDDLYWELQWAGLTTTGGALHNPEYGFFIAESMATAVLVDPGQAKDLAEKLKAGGQDIRNIIILGTSEGLGDEAATHFPADINIERFDGSHLAGLAGQQEEASGDQADTARNEALRGLLNRLAKAAMEDFLDKPGGMRDRVLTRRERQPDLVYGLTGDPLPDALNRRVRRRQ